jgi:signal transduction histidine kinase
MDKTKKSVLIIDDENSNIIALSHILSPEYVVYAAKNGKDAIKATEKYLPHVILLDILMPEMDGYAVIAALKSSEATQDIPVIFITGLSAPGDEEKGLALGAADYITKPFSPAIVKLRVNYQIKMLDSLHELENREVQLQIALMQAAAASKAKGDFLSTMSHEMRTPMNAIIGMTAIAKKTQSIEQKDHALNKIGEASSHLLGVINDVLDMAKIEANRLEIEPIEYNFEKMLQKVITVIGFRMDEKKQQFSINVDKNIPLFVIGDELRLSQVITNLMSNATKFTPENGKIQLDAFLHSEEDGVCELRVEIADNGIGISSEKLAKLFRAFEQGESGISRDYGGTGLGLVISKRIVELMGGEIWAESEPGKGAKFIFTIEVKRSDRSNETVSEEADVLNQNREAIPGEFAGKKMLLAEDMDINRVIIIALLEETQVVIECAKDGKEAVEMLTANPNGYDVVLMDMQMPRMDGLEATRRIRAMGATVPIIAMTANVFKEDIEACLEAGMNAHLGKPLDNDKVVETLRKYLMEVKNDR